MNKGKLFWAVFYTFLLGTQISTFAAKIHVNPNSGNNANPATRDLPLKTISKALELSKTSSDSENTIFLHPGLYQINEALTVETNNGAKTIIQALYMPNDADWEITRMPIIQSVSNYNATFRFPHAAGFQVAASNVTIKGVKFIGNPNPEVKYYYPINRDDTASVNLTVSQCVFVGEPNSAKIQGGVYVLGEGLQVDHCIFYNCRNGVLRFSVEGIAAEKYKNSITNTIIYGAYEGAIWSYTKLDFEFKNNIVSDCNYFWVKDLHDTNHYTFSDCIISNFEHFIYSNQREGFVEVKNVNLDEINVLKKADVKLGINTEAELQNENLHVIKGSDGYDLKAGIFK